MHHQMLISLPLPAGTL